MIRRRCTKLVPFSLLVALALLTVFATSAAQAQPRCTNPKGNIAPGRLLENLNLALRGLPTECDWAREVRQTFPNSMGSGSYNIPVIAAAIALVVDPVRSGSWDGITAGRARLDLPARLMTADNFPPTSSAHGRITATITGLPTGSPSYHIILGP